LVLRHLSRLLHRQRSRADHRAAAGGALHARLPAAGASGPPHRPLLLTSRRRSVDIAFLSVYRPAQSETARLFSWRIQRSSAAASSAAPLPSTFWKTATR